MWYAQLTNDPFTSQGFKTYKQALSWFYKSNAKFIYWVGGSNE